MRSFENPILLIFLLIGFVFISKTSKAQVGEYDLLKSKYDRLKSEKKLDSALFVAKQINQWAYINEGDTSLRYAVSFRYIGNVLHGDSAIFYFRISSQTLIGQKRGLTEDFVRSTYYMGLVFSQAENYAEALIHLEDSYEILNTLSENKGDIELRCGVIETLAWISFQQNHKVENASNLYKESLALKIKQFGAVSKEVAICNYKLGVLFMNIKDQETAISYFEESLNLYKKTNGSKDPFYSNVLETLSSCYGMNYQYDMAIQCILQYLEINKCAIGEENLNYAKKLFVLSAYYSLKGDNKSALTYGEQSLVIKQRILGEDHIDYIQNLNVLGEVYYYLGDYESAKNNHLKSLEFIGNLKGKEHPDYALTLNGIGNACLSIGDYNCAKSNYESSLEIYRKSFGEESEDYAMLLSNLGVVYKEIGQLKLAESYCQKSLGIRKRILGEEHPDYEASISNLANLYSLMGDYELTEKYYKQCLNIIKKNYSINHPEYASILSNLGLVYNDMGQFKKAESYYKHSLNIRKEILGEEHPDYAGTLNNLGNNYADKRDYKSAQKCYERSLSITKKKLGEENIEFVKIINNLGILFFELENYYSADTCYVKVLDFNKNRIKNNFFSLSTYEKQLFWDQESNFFNFLNLLTVSIYSYYPSASELSYNSNIMSKSLLLETSRELDQVISSSNNEELKSQFNEMKQLRRLYSKMQSEGSDKKELMDFYNSKADSLDKILVNQLGEYAAAKRKFEITWKDIQTGLSPNDATIEFASYCNKKDSTTKYMALVVRPGYEYPKMVKIGSEPEIKEAIQMKDFSTLYSLVWQGIDSLLENVSRVYYSPDGELNNLSFSGLYRRENGSDSISYLIDRYELHQLTTTRYLADGTLSKQQPFEASAALLGGIDYNQIPTINVASKTEESNEDYLLHLNLDKEVHQSRSSSFSSKMPPLKGTEIEVKTISGLLNQAGWQATTYTGQSAGENQIKYDLLQKSPGILHIATHGFAFPDIVKKETDLIQMNEKSTYKASEDPMVRCGLMLSGSNISWSGGPKKMIEQTGDDGILTAAEVANMDLSNTKLVVLSACETGLGKIEGSEGTFGLKRAFKLAGVEQLIVSLWSVPDKETMELMTLFYADLTLTKDPTVSFAKAQRQMRNLYPSEPEKWAGFVLER